jgi:mannosyltransferase OCH1-like enzyme
MPPLMKKCIKSWQKYCKDYEFREWNEQTFDVAAAPLYVRQAYEAKKWAFVADYVRLYAMVNYGGIYMDTDVEVIKPLDQYLQHQAFSGF